MVENFAAGAIDNGGKFSASVVDTGGNFAAGTSGKFATGVVYTGGAPWLANISEIFEKFETVLKEYSGPGIISDWMRWTKSISSDTNLKQYFLN